MLDESKLPLITQVDKFLPTEQGEPPLGRAKTGCPTKASHWNCVPCLVCRIV